MGVAVASESSLELRAFGCHCFNINSNARCQPGTANVRRRLSENTVFGVDEDLSPVSTVLVNLNENVPGL